MKKNLLVLALCYFFSSSLLNAQLTIKNLNLDVQHADVSAVDIDKDGDLDILISGESGPDRKLQLFKNDGAGNYTLAASPFIPVTRTTFDWNDVNGDGRLDLNYSGFSASGVLNQIYTSDAAGNFSLSSITTPQLAPSTGFADLNNDGYVDLYIFGNKFDGKPVILFNNKAGGFTQSAQFEAFNFVDPEVSVVDYDNDGDLDLFVNAGFEDGVAGRFSKMFVNTNGTFTVRDLGLTPKGNGSAVWADYNGDGFLDLLLNGDGYLGSGEDNDGVYRLYRNNGGTLPTFTSVATFTYYRQNSTGDGGKFFDWDNDGDLDIIVTGYNGTRQATDIYINTAGTFAPYAFNANIPGVSESSIEVANIDGDTDLDVIITGYSNHEFNGAGSSFNSNVSYILVNPATTTNVAPTSPLTLAATGNQAAVTLTWSPATDATTPINSLTYNLFLVNTSTGYYHYFPLADTSTGKLMLQRLGNMQTNKSWTIKNLPVGNYRWGVQAIDNSLMASTFAKSSFTINANGTLPVLLSSFTVSAEGNKAKIQWATSSEQNNDRFEIKRSNDGQNFTTIAVVKGKGTTNAKTDYTAFDASPFNGTNFYRLIQYNLDGKATDHGTRSLKFSGGKTNVSVFPNPVATVINIKLQNYAGKNIEAKLTDLQGRLIHSEKIATNPNQSEYKLSLKKKPVSGQYILLVAGDAFKEAIRVQVK